MRPEQPLPNNPDSPDPIPEPVVNSSTVETVSEAIPELEKVFTDVNTFEVISAETVADIKDQIDILKQSRDDYEKPSGDVENKISWVRRNIKRVTATISVVALGIFGGVTTNVLTSEEAAMTLLHNLEKAFELLLKLF